MDRRVLLYVFALTVLFFFLHQYFDTGDGPIAHRSKEYHSSVTDIQITDEAKAPTPLQSQDLGSFNIIKLYEDVDLTKFATFAIEQNQNFLTTSWTAWLPKNLYFETKEGTVSSSSRLFLNVVGDEVGDPVLYSAFDGYKLAIEFVPSTGTYPIKLIYFEGDKAFVIDGQTTGFRNVKFSTKPPQPALVLFEYQKKLTPYGYYDPHTNILTYLNRIPGFDETANLVYPETEQIEKEFAGEKQRYYVLENAYQQLVFTDLNGALAEINLPFHSETHPQSVVREIEVGKTLQEKYPDNARFPQFSYQIPNSKDSQPPGVGGYYPLLRRDIISSGGRPTTKIPPHYYGMNIIWEPNAPESHVYKLKRFDKDLIEFELTLNNRKITKTFSLPEKPDEAPYVFDLTVKVEGDSRGLLMTPGIPEVELISGSFTPTLKYRLTLNQKAKVEKVKPPKALVNFAHVRPDWVCNGNGFFGIILDPLTEIPQGFSVHNVPGDISPTRLSVIDALYDRFPVQKYPGYEMHLPLPLKSGTTHYRVFAGPFDKNILQTVDNTFTNPLTGYNPDYLSTKSYFGWFSFISQPFAKLLFFLLDFFHTITGSWGFSIILLTIALKLMLYPLNSWSIRSTLRMQKVTPKITAIQEKYKKDPNRAKMEVMNLYRKEKVNPFGGCFPMLIQLPFLLGMFDLLKSSFELRGATFIPGWIDNLTAPDTLFSWNYPIPFIGNSFHLLPLLLGATMFVQQKYLSASKMKGVKETDQQRQQRSMSSIMTIVMTVLFYNFPSGLNIYWISSMLIGIFQQWWISKRSAVKK